MTGLRRTAARRVVKLWFALDAAVALAPPLYWIADGRMAPILGVPAALFYFLAIDVCIAASIVTSYFVERDATEPA